MLSVLPCFALEIRIFPQIGVKNSTKPIHHRSYVIFHIFI